MTLIIHSRGEFTLHIVVHAVFHIIRVHLRIRQHVAQHDAEEDAFRRKHDILGGMLLGQGLVLLDGFYGDDSLGDQIAFLFVLLVEAHVDGYV